MDILSELSGVILALISNLSVFWIIYFVFISFILLILIFTAATNLFVGPFLRKKIEIRTFPMVSILVPARNEEKNIRRSIESIVNQDYPNYEIIILDDNSTDNTYKICLEYKNSDNFRLLKGGDLLPGWLGKNNACRQLAENATGEILIFTDADNFHEKFAVSNTVAYMQKYNLGMLSAFPQQFTNSFWEKLIIPVIDLIIYSGLILWTTFLLPFKVFAAANGQWIAFTRLAYDKIGGHNAVKHHIVEDVALSRAAKDAGIKTLTTAGTGAVYGKMYSNFGEIWQGLSKNIYGLTDFKAIPFFILLSLIFICGILPYFLLFDNELRPFATIAVALNILWRIFLSIGFKHSVVISTILHPLSLLMLISIGVNSFIASTFGTLKWKGRDIKIHFEEK
ncbi:MAG: glycosyltransferase [Candidatus Kapabacteria bacterium]|nr:glycosyltransferase [Ignavibacteriota bacterium]MCW5886114.1 glycosyltransferase [Candidatus Kapabacteria bacterium]